MMGWIKKLTSQVDFYAAHCYGRRQSYLPLGTFFAVDGLVNGALKTLLKPFLGGTSPALITFFYYLYSFFVKAKETYQAHPDNLDPELEKEKLTDTTEMILLKFKQHKTEALAYLEGLALDHEEIESLLSANEENMVARFAVFHKIHDEIHPHHASFFNSFKAGVLHALTHVNEYLLLRYFADLNLLSLEGEFSAGNVLGFSMLLVALLSGSQTYSFCNKPLPPSSDELLEVITGDFRLFRRGQYQKPAFPEETEKTYRHNGSEAEKVKLLVGYNAAQKCYLGCK